MITIRIATANDAELIATMSRTTFIDSFAAQNTKENMDLFMEQQFTHEALMQEVGAPGNIFLLAYDGEEAAGYIRMRENNQEKGLEGLFAIEIARIYAVKSAIGKGVGSALMKEAIAIAHSRHYQVIWLGVWEHNERAIAFYTKWGFEKFGEHPFMLGHDLQTDWLMKKEITPAD